MNYHHHQSLHLPHSHPKSTPISQQTHSHFHFLIPSHFLLLNSLFIPHSTHTTLAFCGSLHMTHSTLFSTPQQIVIQLRRIQPSSLPSLVQRVQSRIDRQLPQRPTHIHSIRQQEIHRKDAITSERIRHSTITRLFRSSRSSHSSRGISHTHLTAPSDPTDPTTDNAIPIIPP